MTANIALHQWVYMLVEKAQTPQQIIGQQDTALDIRFIPIFLDRDAAQLGATHFGIKVAYEIQAIIFEDLLGYAAQNHFLIFLFDGQGTLLLKYTPEGQTV